MTFNFKEICYQIYEAINLKRPGAVECVSLTKNCLINSIRLEIQVHTNYKYHVDIKENDCIENKIKELVNKYWNEFD
jgi:CRISPR/Cas system CSM-associated protein Csm5 (group 7 of RAMP superfamily)